MSAGSTKALLQNHSDNINGHAGNANAQNPSADAGLEDALNLNDLDPFHLLSDLIVNLVFEYIQPLKEALDRVTVNELAAQDLGSKWTDEFPKELEGYHDELEATRKYISEHWQGDSAKEFLERHALMQALVTAVGEGCKAVGFLTNKVTQLLTNCRNKIKEWISDLVAWLMERALILLGTCWIPVVDAVEAEEFVGEAALRILAKVEDVLQLIQAVIHVLQQVGTVIKELASAMSMIRDLMVAFGADPGAVGAMDQALGATKKARDAADKANQVIGDAQQQFDQHGGKLGNHLSKKKGEQPRDKLEEAKQDPKGFAKEKAKEIAKGALGTLAGKGSLDDAKDIKQRAQNAAAKLNAKFGGGKNGDSAEGAKPAEHAGGSTPPEHEGGGEPNTPHEEPSTGLSAPPEHPGEAGGVQAGEHSSPPPAASHESEPVQQAPAPSSPVSQAPAGGGPGAPVSGGQGGAPTSEGHGGAPASGGQGGAPAGGGSAGGGPSGAPAEGHPGAAAGGHGGTPTGGGQQPSAPPAGAPAGPGPAAMHSGGAAPAAPAGTSTGAGSTGAGASSAGLSSSAGAGSGAHSGGSGAPGAPSAASSSAPAPTARPSTSQPESGGQKLTATSSAGDAQPARPTEAGKPSETGRQVSEARPTGEAKPSGERAKLDQPKEAVPERTPEKAEAHPAADETKHNLQSSEPSSSDQSNARHSSDEASIMRRPSEELEETGRPTSERQEVSAASEKDEHLASSQSHGKEPQDAEKPHDTEPPQPAKAEDPSAARQPGEHLEDASAHQPAGPHADSAPNAHQTQQHGDAGHDTAEQPAHGAGADGLQAHDHTADPAGANGRPSHDGATTPDRAAAAPTSEHGSADQHHGTEHDEHLGHVPPEQRAAVAQVLAQAGVNLAHIGHMGFGERLSATNALHKAGMTPAQALRVVNPKESDASRSPFQKHVEQSEQKLHDNGAEDPAKAKRPQDEQDGERKKPTEPPKGEGPSNLHHKDDEGRPNQHHADDRDHSGRERPSQQHKDAAVGHEQDFGAHHDDTGHSGVGSHGTGGDQHHGAAFGEHHADDPGYGRAEGLDRTDLADHRMGEHEWVPGSGDFSTPKSEDPHVWVEHINPGFHDDPGRRFNCVECSRSVEANFRGEHIGAASLADAASAENPQGRRGTSGDRLESWSRGQLQPTSYQHAVDMLKHLGPGSSALAALRGPSGGHAFNFVNHHGKILLIDAQVNRIHDVTNGKFPHDFVARTQSLQSVFMDHEGRPFSSLPEATRNAAPQFHTDSDGSRDHHPSGAPSPQHPGHLGASEPSSAPQSAEHHHDELERHRQELERHKHAFDHHRQEFDRHNQESHSHRRDFDRHEQQSGQHQRDSHKDRQEFDHHQYQANQHRQWMQQSLLHNDHQAAQYHDRESRNHQIAADRHRAQGLWHREQSNDHHQQAGSHQERGVWHQQQAEHHQERGIWHQQQQDHHQERVDHHQHQIEHDQLEAIRHWEKPEGWTAHHDGAIATYTGSGHRGLNEYLMEGHTWEEVWTSEHGTLNNLLTQAHKMLPDHPGTVYRGVHMTLDDLARYVPDKRVKELAFLSTSTDPKITDHFNQRDALVKEIEEKRANGVDLPRDQHFPVRFEIEQKSGKDIGALSGTPGEGEVLMRPGRVFDVISKEWVDGVCVIRMKELMPKKKPDNEPPQGE